MIHRSRNWNLLSIPLTGLVTKYSSECFLHSLFSHLNGGQLEAIPITLFSAKIALTGSSWCLGRSLDPFHGGPVARSVLFFLVVLGAAVGAVYVLFNWLLFRLRRG